MRTLITLLLLSSVHYLNGLEWTRRDINQSGEHAGRLSKTVSSHLEKKYGLHCCGAGLSMPGGPIRSIGLSFSIKGPLTLSQLRRLTVGCIDDMVRIVANDRAIQPYLHSPPYGLQSADLNFFVQDGYGREVMFPDASGVSVMDGKLSYCYSDPEEKVFPYLKIVKESYEEAIETIRQEDAKILNARK